MPANPRRLTARAALTSLLCTVAFWSGAHGATQREIGSRPRVGLALSGGGARGAAHVGVLRVLDELRIPVDFVAGTSMGSIVGGLYCSGLSPTELEAALADVDWNEAFVDAPARKRISFRRKEDDAQALFPFELGVGKRGFSTKSGLVAGQKVNFLLRTLTLHTAGIDSFDELPIPYRAVAADLETGEMVVLDRGDLAQAMRASLSLPGVFTPVEIDGRLLVDGGIARNLPVDVVRAMGAERIIAVDVGTPTPAGGEGPRSAVGVATQTILAMANRNVLEQLELLGDEDLLITPDLTEVKSTDFGRVAAAMDAGEAAARAEAAQLAEFAVSERRYADYLVGRRRPQDTGLPEATIDSVELRGTTRIDPAVITRRLKTQAGEKLNLGDLRDDLERIHQLGDFERVDFRLVEENERNRLVIDSREKSWGPGYLRFGIGLETNFGGDSDFGVIANYRRANVNRLGAEWKTVVRAGDPFSIDTEFFQPFDLTGFWFFVAPGFSLARDRSESFFLGTQREVVQRDTALARLDFGVQFRNWGEIRIGAATGALQAGAKTAAMLPDLDVDLGGWTAKATLDQLDDPFFPRHGNLSELTLLLSRDAAGADDEYDKLSLRTVQAWSVGGNTLIGGFELGSNLGSRIPFYDEFELGGFFDLSGLQRDEFRGDVKGLLTLGYYRRIAWLGALGRGLYLGGVVQAGNVWPDLSAAGLDDLIYSGTVFAGADTRLVPIYVGYGQAEGGESEFYLLVGRPF